MCKFVCYALSQVSVKSIVCLGKGILFDSVDATRDLQAFNMLFECVFSTGQPMYNQMPNYNQQQYPSNGPPGGYSQMAHGQRQPYPQQQNNMPPPTSQYGNPQQGGYGSYPGQGGQGPPTPHQARYGYNQGGQPGPPPPQSQAGAGGAGYGGYNQGQYPGGYQQ